MGRPIFAGGLPLLYVLLIPFLLWMPIAEAADSQDNIPAYGEDLQGFDYAWPVHEFQFNSQRQTLHMAYLDVPPVHSANGKVAVLLHGKNFCAGTWEGTIRALTTHGYRVIAPDQIGFCKSSKPQAYQFTFQQLAVNTRALLEHLGIHHYILIGHSTGGMLAIRYALMFPHDLTQLVLVDPIGLEDWAHKGVPYQTVDQWYAQEKNKTAAQIKHYEQHVYYAGQWQPQYDRWVTMLAGMYKGPGKDAVAWDSALLYDMIATEPVVYELPHIRVPTTLMIGDKDITAIGSAAASPAVRKTLGHYPELGKMAAKAIPNAKLIEFADLGHAPQIQAPELFNHQLLNALDAQ